MNDPGNVDENLCEKLNFYFKHWENEAQFVAKVIKIAFLQTKLSKGCCKDIQEK